VLILAVPQPLEETAMFKHTSFAIIAAFAAGLTLQVKAAEPQSVEVEGTEFKVTFTDGHVLPALARPARRQLHRG
jgi:hypothetical protein